MPGGTLKVGAVKSSVRYSKGGGGRGGWLRAWGWNIEVL